jgi:hypothetical protein
MSALAAHIDWTPSANDLERAENSEHDVGHTAIICPTASACQRADSGTQARAGTLAQRYPAT